MSTLQFGQQHKSMQCLGGQIDIIYPNGKCTYPLTQQFHFWKCIRTGTERLCVPGCWLQHLWQRWGHACPKSLRLSSLSWGASFLEGGCPARTTFPSNPCIQVGRCMINSSHYAVQVKSF